MRTSYIYQIEVLEAEYSDLFHCHIEFETDEKYGLKCTVTLVDNEDSDKRIILGIGYSGDYDMGTLHSDAIELLSRERYCVDVFKKHCR